MLNPVDFTYVRLASVTLDNFVAVVHGTLRLTSTDRIAHPCLLGLFGQNGSGKTTLIRALSLFKTLLTERPLDDQWVNAVRRDSKTARLQFEFHCYADVESRMTARVFYQVVLQRVSTRVNPVGILLQKESSERVEIQSESLWTVPSDEEAAVNHHQQTLRADTSAQRMGFEPTALHEVLLGRRSEFKNDLRVGQGLAAARRTSFLFAETLAAVLQKGAGKTTESPNDCNELLQWLRRLEQYGRSELFVLESPGSYRSQRNTLPLCLAEDADEKRSGGGRRLALPLEAPFAVVPKRMAAIRKAIEALNRVLEQWVPGLAVGVASLGRALGVNGEIVERAQLVSYKNGREIPLALESDGIKEMLAVLPLLIEVYNCRSLTVAADDLDAGLFEYLFGELLQIFSQGGRGQLIFTSHNLRVLEVLNSAGAAVTTADPSNRFAHLKTLGLTGNLRDAYYRQLILGTGKSLNLALPFDRGRIALAMREAGQIQMSEDCSKRIRV